jgi:AraC family transcriptional regulator of adaptative response / DNA-3-methyladenine glycosylase II
MRCEDVERSCLEATGAGLADHARLHRLDMANLLLASSDLPMPRIAELAGFPSRSVFEREFKKLYGRTPASLRRKRSRVAGEISLHLPVRAPYNHQWVFDFLKRRALHGIETVADTHYERVVQRSDRGDRSLALTWTGEGYDLRVPAVAVSQLSTLLGSLRRMLDLDADSNVIDAELARSPTLERWVREQPGLRIPGAFSGFEIAVRAILGQQVSVARATTLSDKLIARYSNDGLFPSPQALNGVNVAGLGMPGRRGQAIGLLARHVAEGNLQLEECSNPAALHDRLTSIPGIGPWTASYICLRVARQADAFPEQDWVVMKVLGSKARECRQIAEAWRPWRGYALMYLWYASGRLAELQTAD